MQQLEPAGQFLFVDLDSGCCRLSKPPEEILPYLGGRGFNSWYLYRHLCEGVDPLSPENILILSAGLLTGSPAPASARLHISALSPLTGILGSSNIGGYAGAWLRTHNIASVIVTGKSSQPSYLYIGPDTIQIKDASHLWGCDTRAVQEVLEKSLAPVPVKILCIGPSAENRVLFSAIISEKDHAAGRTGMGTVMGAKNLKAIAVAKGQYRHFSARTRESKDAVAAYVSKVRQAPDFKFFSRYGGAGYIRWANDMGILSGRNYSRKKLDRIDAFDGTRLDGHKVRSTGCFRCPVQCKADLVLNKGSAAGNCTRPEFEPLVNLGPKCGLEDLEAVVRLDNLCNRLGMDSTSAGTAISFAMDLYDRELLPPDLADGLILSWGNAAAMETLLYQMSAGTGLGKVLGQGVQKAAAELGGQASRFAPHVKGLELTAYHPASIMGSALGYAVSSRGGDYNNVFASLEYSWTPAQAEAEFGTREAVNIKSCSAKGALVKKAVITNILVDCLGLCKVPVLSLLRSFNLESEVELLNGLTGWNLTGQDLMDIGERIAVLEKRIMLRHGGAAMKDTLPEMFFSKSAETGLSRDKFDVMLKDYYTAMGWDENGFPPGAGG